jgi:hypothetical protein
VYGVAIVETQCYNELINLAAPKELEVTVNVDRYLPALCMYTALMLNTTRYSNDFLTLGHAGAQKLYLSPMRHVGDFRLTGSTLERGVGLGFHVEGWSGGWRTSL